MRILFLDIDGVLNSTRSAIGLGGYGLFPRHVNERNKNNDGWLREQTNLDPVAVGILNRIVIETGCHVVISSTWRIGIPYHDFNRLFSAYGLPPVVIGTTGQSDDGHRGDEIRAWLAAHPDVESYVIVDDDSDMLDEQLPHFVHTDGQVGLDTAAYQSIIRRWPPLVSRK